MMDTYLSKLSIFGQSYIGAYCRVTDAFAFVPYGMTDSAINTLRETLKVNIVPASVDGSGLLGIFTAANSSGVLVPYFTTKKEKPVFKETGLNLGMLKTEKTATGNQVLANDRGAIISPHLEAKSARMIGDTLGVEVVKGTIAGFDYVGTAGIVTNKGGLVHPGVTEDELKVIQDVLKVKLDVGTANFGAPLVGACIIANSSGAVIGEDTTGPEISRIDEALGFF